MSEKTDTSVCVCKIKGREESSVPGAPEQLSCVHLSTRQRVDVEGWDQDPHNTTKKKDKEGVVYNTRQRQRVNCGW